MPRPAALVSQRFNDQVGKRLHLPVRVDLTVDDLATAFRSPARAGHELQAVVGRFNEQLRIFKAK